MKQSLLRISIYFFWIGSLLISILALLLTPALRNDNAIGYSQINSAIPVIIGLHLPALSTFAAFWFPSDERQRAAKISVSIEAAIGAISITAVYLFIQLVMVIWPLAIVSYEVAGIELPSSESFTARINDAVKISLMLSPIALAPSAFLTRRNAKKVVKNMNKMETDIAKN